MRGSFKNQTFSLAASSTDTVWLGIHDRPSEGSFMSVSGRPVEYLNWYPYEPNGGVVENCVSMITTTYAGSWADQKCSEQQPFICRKPLPGVVRISILGVFIEKYFCITTTGIIRKETQFYWIMCCVWNLQYSSCFKIIPNIRSQF